MEYLSQNEVIHAGIEFAGDVCYSGEYGQQVYTREAEDGGVPVEGIVYENYPSGSLNYYCYYKNGIPHGEKAEFYECGKIKSYCIMDTGTIDGEKVEWYENGKIKRKQTCKYGLVLKLQEFDEDGNLVKEKKDLSEGEKITYEKWRKHYEGNS